MQIGGCLTKCKAQNAKYRNCVAIIDETNLANQKTTEKLISAVNFIFIGIKV